MDPDQMELIDGLSDEALDAIIDDLMQPTKYSMSASFFALSVHPVMCRKNVTPEKVLDYCRKSHAARHGQRQI